ncbi:hypothetical protein FUA23_14975 [Neolewinella aurantiaca]|uniref:Uncharacterized protein n=1 Tax=Neolewinella aurantiaca TaxID=2602767 RepID=A0A5C7FPS2_9BACT|nr:hypothetical protein [Neolewinella aurantiaca]TXF88436.1 hypothetical protein FUA23_14975 [Neolewinella aurantiaca]
MKKSMLILTVVMILLVSGLGSELLAQCPMCRATAETNLANGGTEGKGLNNGILYMLGMPYILIGTIAILWWKNRKTGEELEQA